MRQDLIHHRKAPRGHLSGHARRVRGPAEVPDPPPARRTPVPQHTDGHRGPELQKQALFVIAWFRDRPNITRHGTAFDVSQATAYRYPHEAIDVLAEQAPDPHRALEQAAADGLLYLIMDGKIFATDRCRHTITSVKGETLDAWYSGKTHGFGGNIQAVFEPGGLPIVR